MKYQKITIGTTPEYEDIVCAALYDMGIEEMEIDDGTAVEDEYTPGVYPELQPDVSEDQGCRIYLYREEDFDTASLISDIESELSFYGDKSDVIPGGISCEMCDDADWKDNWKDYFHAFNVGDIYIHPSWEESETHSNGIDIEIDPGMSFGTGAHESTRIILGQLSDFDISGKKVLDIGCGSGILSIALLKKGAKTADLLDIDPDCIVSSKENLERNDIDMTGVDFHVGNLSADEALRAKVGGGYDIVVCNILADIIIDMADAICATLADGGILMTSGIIDFKENEVLDALSARGLVLLDTVHIGEWCGITMRRGAGED